MLQRFNLLAIHLAWALVMAGCDGGADHSPRRAEDGPFRVALLSPGPISDAGWNAAAYEGLLLIKEELGAEIAQVQTSDPGSREEAFRDFGRQGYHLVFGHGYEYVDAATTVCNDYPDTVFITTSGDQVRRNLAAIVFELEQATYLLGMVAGKLTRSGRVGMIGGMNIPSIDSTFIAFEAGVLSANSEAQVARSFVGNWEDVSAAKELTLAQINSGVDFIFQNADAAGQGVFQAAEEVRGQRRVFVFGSNKDQNHVAPGVILASAVIDIPRTFLAIAREVREGRFVPEVKRMRISDGVISVAFNPALLGEIPEDVMKLVQEREAQITAGTLRVPRGNF